jgi:hypothetical protein
MKRTAVAFISVACAFVGPHVPSSQDVPWSAAVTRRDHLSIRVNQLGTAYAESPGFNSDGGAVVPLIQSSAARDRPLMSDVDAFSDARTPDDVMPTIVTGSIDGLSRASIGTKAPMGAPLAAQSRRTLSGSPGGPVFLVPTSAGWLCLVRATDVLHCAEDLVDRLATWRISHSGRGSVVIHGVVSRSVTAVDVKFGDQVVTALLDRGSFIATTRLGEFGEDGVLVLSLADGSEAGISLAYSGR